MWSAEYNSAGGIWGCGCCADGGADGGPVNTLWAVYKSSSNSPKRPSVDVRPTAQASKDACCEADVVDQCVGNTVSGTSGLVAAPPDIICGSGMKAKSAGTKGRSVAECCDDVDGCGINPDCGVGGVCSDVPAPLDGYACSCAVGYSGPLALSKPTVCSENPCTDNPGIENINGASECAGTESGSTCEFKCAPGYRASGKATCTRGTWDKQTCDQRYKWLATPEEFDECQTKCGAKARTCLLYTSPSPRD